jgi:hypothetical protein
MSKKDASGGVLRCSFCAKGQNEESTFVMNVSTCAQILSKRNAIGRIPRRAVSAFQNPKKSQIISMSL